MQLTPQAYAALCAEHPAWPLFAQPWWLDAVTEGQWQLAMATDTAHRPVAVWPYATWRRRGFRYVANPALTPRLGVCWLSELDVFAQQPYVEQLLEGMPRYALLDCNFHYDAQNIQPYVWAGLQASTRYSYVLDTRQDANAMLLRMQDSTRRQIKKAEQLVQVRPLNDVTALYRLAQLSMERQGARLPYDLHTLVALDQAAAQHNTRMQWVAIDEQGTLVAALYVVWDARRMYYLISGMDPAHKHTGAMSLLVWQAVQLAREHNLLFDFEGSMLPGVAQFFAGFGAVAQPYQRIYHYRSTLLQLLQRK